MADATTTIPKEAETLRSWLVSGNADVGEVHVVGADLAWDEDSEGQPILRFNVALANPSDETWRIDDVVEFHRKVEDQASELGLAVPRYVGIQAEEPEDLDLS